MTWQRAIVVGALCVGAAAAQGQRASADSIRIVFFDVGQGDAALITTPEGKHILIDAGPSGPRIMSLLEAYGLHTLDMVIASHNHADHIGGMADVFAAYQVKEYMDNGVPALTKAYRRTVEAVEKEKGIKVRTASWREFSAGEARLRVLPPPHVDEAQNNNSVGIWVTFGRFDAVFTGDAEGPELNSWLAAWNMSGLRVVKASHHGSFNGATRIAYLATPRGAVCFCSFYRRQRRHQVW